VPLHRGIWIHGIQATSYHINTYKHIMTDNGAWGRIEPLGQTPRESFRQDSQPFQGQDRARSILNPDVQPEDSRYTADRSNEGRRLSRSSRPSRRDQPIPPWLTHERPVLPPSPWGRGASLPSHNPVGGIGHMPTPPAWQPQVAQAVPPLQPAYGGSIYPIPAPPAWPPQVA